MNNQEAIQALKQINLKRVQPFYSWEEMKEVRDIAILAIEKQIPKKIENWNGQASCPNCKKLYGNMEDIKRFSFLDFDYCKYCGQKLDWSDND